MQTPTRPLSSPPTLRRMALRVLGIALFLNLALVVSTRALYADTITIVDGAASGPNQFGDAFIQTQLASGHYTIDTAAATGGGPDDIRVEPGVVITWTSGFSLTLVAGQNIVISGTIQHDGPANGSGGLALLADDDGNNVGDVALGLGGQPDAIMVGSRHGLTRVDATNVRLRAGDASAANRFVLLGFRAVNQGVGYNVSGAISVTAALSVTATAGESSFNYVQVGHGGADRASNFSIDGTIGGDHTIVAGDDIIFTAGSFLSAYAQVGNGGIFFHGDCSGSHILIAGSSTAVGLLATPGGDILFTAGGEIGTYAQVGNGGGFSEGNDSGNHTLTAEGEIDFSAGDGSGANAQVGNGGVGTVGDHTGNHTLNAGGNISFTGGGTSAYAQVGNGGINATGNYTGSHTLTANGDIAFSAGSAAAAYAQAGNGGNFAQGDHNGDHTLNAGRNISFTGGGEQAYAQAGNGGINANGSHSGSHTLTANGDIVFSAGSAAYAYAQAGNGGTSAWGVHGGSHTLNAGGNISFTGGGDQAYAQAGNGGTNANGSHNGNHLLDAGGNIVFSAGSDPFAYAQAGNGGTNADGSHSGSHTLIADSSIIFTGDGVNDYVQVGNGGNESTGNHSGSHILNAGNAIIFTGGNANDAYAQVGNGGDVAKGNHSGSHTLRANGNISFTGSGEDAYTQVGNGGNNAIGNHTGSHTLNAGGAIAFTGGSGEDAFAQVGNGGNLVKGNHSGDLHLTATGSLTLTAGTTKTAFAMIGHGATTTITGTRSGNITLELGENLVLQGAHIGHVSSDGPSAILDGNTLIGVSQNDPSPTGLGEIQATNNAVHTVGFNSAHSPNGELRFYVPDADNITIPAGTLMNSENFPGTVPANRIAGNYLFANGPYIAGADYAFYFGADLPQVQFAANAYSLLENNGPALITVTLNITSVSAVSVTVSSANGSALAGSDYTAVSQTITIAPGLTSAVVSVPITNDAVVEPDETFTVTLSSPVGALLGTTTSAQVTIRNDDGATTPTILLPLLRRQE